MTVHFGGGARRGLGRRGGSASGPIPDLDLDFTTMSGGLDPRITFSRSSTATYFDSSGVLQTASSGSPVIEYNPASHACLGLRSEESRTASILYSNTFANAAWTKGLATIGSSPQVAPDGTTATLMTASAGSGEHRIYQSSGLGAIPATLSVFAKAGTVGYISLSSGSSSSYAVFNLTNGTIAGTSAATPAWIQDCGNGWYRCSVAGGYSFLVTNVANTATNAIPQATWAAAGTETVHLFGAMYEAGIFPTSYIPTTSATVTRAADSVSTTNAGILALLGYRINTADAQASIAATLLGFNAAIVGLGKTSGNALTTTDGGTQTTANTATWTGSNGAVIARYPGTRVTIALNSGTAATAANSPNGLTALYLGSTGGTSAFLNGHISRLRGYVTGDAALAANP